MPILFILAFVAFIAFAIVWGTAEQKKAIAEWQQFAMETGLNLSGAYPMTSFHGAAHGVTVSLAHTVWRGRKGRRHYNHVVSVQLPAMTGDLSVVNEGFLAMLGKAFGGEDIQIGDPDFDSAFRVRCSDPSLARYVLGQAERQALMIGRQAISDIYVQNGWVCVKRPGIGRAAAVKADLHTLSIVANAFARQAAPAQAAYGSANPYAPRAY